MNFVNIAPGTAVFVDANVLVYHFTNHPQFGPACTGLVESIELGTTKGFTSTHVLSETAHRVMLIEASQTLVRPLPGILKWLKRHPQELSKLSGFRQAVQQIPKLGIQILTIAPSLIDAAAAVSQQHGLLSNDALIIAVMQHYGFSQLASHDAGFDGLPGIVRFAPA